MASSTRQRCLLSLLSRTDRPYCDDSHFQSLHGDLSRLIYQIWLRVMPDELLCSVPKAIALNYCPTELEKMGCVMCPIFSHSKPANQMVQSNLCVISRKRLARIKSCFPDVRLKVNFIQKGSSTRGRVCHGFCRPTSAKSREIVC